MSDRVEAARRARSKIFGSLSALPEDRICDHGEGVYLFDQDGKKYMDFTAVPFACIIGHGNKEVAQAAAEQMKKVAMCWPSFWVNEREGELAERILSKVPSNLTQIQFTNSGSEATDSAIKLAQQYNLERGKPEKRIIISRWQSFHGSTLAAVSLTGFTSRRIKFVPNLIDWPKIDAPLCYRCPYGLSYPNCEIKCARMLDRLINQIGAQYVAAFVVEPVGGAASGAMVPVPEYYPMVREICNKHDVLLIVDECVSGFGRTGMWFSIEHWNVQPDILTMAKGMTGAYAPLGGMAIDESIVEVYEKTSAGFVNPFTTAGNPVSCAVCKTVFDIIERDNLVERSARLGEYLYNKAKSEISHHASVGDIRGKGMLLAIELVKDKKTREPFAPSLEVAVKVKNFAMEQGCIIYPSFGTEQGVRGDLLLLAPPYIITEKEIDWALDVIDRAFEKFEKTLGHK